MWSPLTQEGRPWDLIQRWTHLEKLITGEHERKLMSLVRHIATGCSVCRQEEIMAYLTEWPNELATMREALLIIDLLGAAYSASPDGKADRRFMEAGGQFAFSHEGDSDKLTVSKAGSARLIA